MGKKTLEANVESQLSWLDHQQCEQISHSVLSHLWRRLPFDERKHMVGKLPQDILAMLDAPKTPNDPEMTADQWQRQGAIEYSSLEEFCDEIRRDTQLPGEGKDMEAIEAVFGALKTELPKDEVGHVQDMLPSGLKQMWMSA